MRDIVSSDKKHRESGICSDQIILHANGIIYSILSIFYLSGLGNGVLLMETLLISIYVKLWYIACA